MVRFVTASAIVALASAWAPAALAQETAARSDGRAATTTTPDTGPQTNSAPSQASGIVTDAAAPAAQDTGGLQDIVVTAQRRQENLQRAAVPVSAVSGDALISTGVSETANLTKLVPSLVVQPSGGSGMNLYLRGVGTLQSNSFAENAVAFNFNGVYIARPSAPVGTFFDLERLEVVKGPQGTLYGRNATGGAINVLPKRPSLSGFGGDLTVEYGNYGNKKATGAVNIPLGNTVALRVAGQVVDRNGYLSDGYDDEVGQAARVSLLFKPSDLFSAVLVADYFHQGGKGIGSVLAPGAAAPAGFTAYAAPSLDRRIGGSDPRSVAALTAATASQPAPPFCRGGFVPSGCVVPPRGDGFNDSHFYGVSLTIDGDVGFGTLTVIPAYRKSKPDYLSYVPGFLDRITEDDDQLSLEVRLTSNSDQPFRYVVGGYFFHEKQLTSNYFYQGLISTTAFTPRLSTESKAVFGQATLDLASTFRLVGGLRYTDASRTQASASASGGLPGPINPPLGAPFSGRLDFSKVTWRAGVEWDVAPRSLVYATVATGFKAGGFFVAAPPNNTFRPERLMAYTMGAKNRFFDNRLQLNVEAFYWDYKDQQVSYVGGINTGTNGIQPGGVTVNAGKARMYGAEAELLFAVVPKGIFTANVQYLNGKYDSLRYTALSAGGSNIRTGCVASNNRLANPTNPFSPSRLFDLNCSGQPTVNSPKWTANIGYEHTIEFGNDMGLVLGARTRVESSRFVTIDYLPETRQGSYMQSDANITLRGPQGRWSLTGYVNNIEDKTVLAGATVRPVVQAVYSILRPPRTYGVRAGVKF